MSAALRFGAFSMLESVRGLRGAWNHFPSRCVPLAPAPAPSSAGALAPVSAAACAQPLLISPASHADCLEFFVPPAPRDSRIFAKLLRGLELGRV